MRQIINRLERDARDALDAAIRAVQPEVLIEALGSEIWSQTEAPGRLVLMAVGKASESMTRAVLPRLRKTPSLVFITAPRESRCALEGAEIIHAGHPVPDRNSLKAAQRALEIASSLGPSDRLICLVSGGGSAMWAGVPDGLALADIRRTNRALLGSSVSIDNVNTVRRALSTIKAGRLAEAAYPAGILTILLSDVPGDDPSTIASGPSIPSSVDPAAALEILADSDIVVPRSVARYLQEAAHKGAQAAGRSLTWSLPPVILGRNRDAVDAGAFHLARLGYDVTILSAPVYGSARDAGRRIAKRALGERPGVVGLVSGGETIVDVSGTGKGGRNQELALNAALTLDGAERPIVVLSAGTDGVDGPTDAAGAIVSTVTVEAGRRRGIDAGEYLRNNDSYSFFARVGGHIITGPTGTNVSDLQIVLAADADADDTE